MQSSFQGFIQPRPNKGGTNTGDATAIAADIALNKTAYGPLGKIIGTGSNIKSKQSGNGNFTSGQTVTISSVDLTKAVVRISFYVSTATFSSAACHMITAELTNATTITFTAGTAGNTFYIAWEVIEFNNVKSLQNGTLVATPTPQTVAVSSVVMAKSMLFFSFRATTSVGGTAAEMVCSLELTSPTVITAQRESSNVYTYVWYLVEFN